MTTDTPRVLAARSALAMALLASLVYYFATGRPENWRLIMPLGFFLLIFLSSFFLLRYTLNRYIRDKLSMFYDTIHQLKKKPSDKIQILDPENAINEVQEEVIDWYLNNKKEIDRLTILEKYRREFIGNVSHELKTPVFNIQGYLLTLLEGGLEDKSINRKYLERAEKSVEKLIKLLNELDMIIRLDTGGLRLNIQRVNIISIADDVIDSLEMKAEKKNIDLILKRRNKEPLWVHADEDKIIQALTNVVMNSIKYGKEDGKSEISFHDLKDKILIEIKDNGIGIKDSELPRVFDRFYRTDTGRSHDSKGFGLGLSIVKHIVEAHNETVNLNSIEGQGSTFSFTLKKAGVH